MSRALVVAICLLWTCASVGAPAANTSEAAQVTIDALDVGFAGRYKLGSWTEVCVSTSGYEQSAEYLTVVLPDGDGVPCRFHGRRTSCSPNTPRSEYRAVVKFGRAGSRLDVTICTDPAGEQPLVERTFVTDAADAVASTQELIVCLPGVPDFNAAIRLLRQSAVDRSVAVRIDDQHLATLPTLPLGLDGADWLVLSASDDELAIAAWAEPLRRWITGGGKLLLFSGDHTRALAASPLADLLPGKFADTSSANATVVETYSETSERLDAGQAAGITRFNAPRLTGVQGRIEVYDGSNPGDLPLVVRRAFGLGTIVWAGFDLAQPPFSSWGGQRQVIHHLLAHEPPSGAENGEESFGQSGASIGYLDLSGQLRSAMDRFARVKFVPFWHFATLAALYVLLIGPADYFLLKKLNRLQYTWLTFPLLVAIFSGGAWYYAGWAKGDQVQINQVDVLDVDTANAQVRGASFISMFSPRNETWSLRLAPSSRVPDGIRHTAPPAKLAALAWQGLPGGGLGGLDSSTVDAHLFTDAYDVHPDSGEVHAVPLAIWSTKSFVGQVQGTAAALVPQLATGGHGSSLLRESASRQLRGTIANPLSVELRDAVLFYDRWAYPLKTLPAEFSATLEDSVQPVNIESYLAQRRIVGDRDLTVAYDRTSNDIPRILQMLLLHDVVGGKKYTHLLNRFEHQLDLSDHLLLGQAMLIGFGPPAIGLELDGQPLTTEQRDQHLALYRFVLPVDRNN